MKSKSFTMLIVISLLSVLLNASLFAQNSSFSFSFSGGFGYLPQKGVEEFSRVAGTKTDDYGRYYSYFNIDETGRYLDLKFSYHYGSKHGIALHVEHIASSAKGTSVHISLGGPIGTADEKMEFSAFPIGLSYELYPFGRDKKYLPVIGVGPSRFISSMTRTELLNTVAGELQFKEEKYTKTAYGVHLYIEMQVRINSRFFINSRLRGRVMQGPHIIDDDVFEEYDVNFTGLDFTAGFGWRF